MEISIKKLLFALINIRYSLPIIANAILLNFLLHQIDFYSWFTRTFELNGFESIAFLFTYLFVYAMIRFIRTFIQPERNRDYDGKSVSCLEAEANQNRDQYLLDRAKELQFNNRLTNLYYTLCAMLFVLIFTIINLPEIRDQLIIQWYYLIPVATMASLFFMIGVQADLTDYTKVYWSETTRLRLD